MRKENRTKIFPSLSAPFQFYNPLNCLNGQEHWGSFRAAVKFSSRNNEIQFFRFYKRIGDLSGPKMPLFLRQKNKDGLDSDSDPSLNKGLLLLKINVDIEVGWFFFF